MALATRYRCMTARTCRRGFAAVLVTFLIFGNIGTAQVPDWKAEADLLATLESPADIVWSETPLSDAMRSLSEAYRVAIFRDRRVDPGLRLNYQGPSDSLRSVLTGALSGHRLGVGNIGPVLYLGPIQTALRVATAAELSTAQLSKLEAARRKRMLRSVSTSWPQLSTPRSLVSGLAVEAGLKLVNGNVIPHDLWDAQQFPPLTWSERMSLVLCGFDLQYQIDPTQLQLVLTVMPRSLTVSREYDLGPAADDRARQLNGLFPQAFIRVHQGRLSIRSVVEDQREIQAWLERMEAGHDDAQAQTRHGATAVPKNRRYTLTVKDQPLGPLLTVLAQRVGHRLEIEPDARPGLETRVSFSVQEVPLRGLLEAAISPAGLEVQIVNQTIRVREREK